MLRLIITIAILVSIFIYALIYSKSTLVKRQENSISLIEVGKSIEDIKKNNSDRKKTIEENEKLLEDLNENN